MRIGLRRKKLPAIFWSVATIIAITVNLNLKWLVRWSQLLVIAGNTYLMRFGVRPKMP